MSLFDYKRIYISQIGPTNLIRILFLALRVCLNVSVITILKLSLITNRCYLVAKNITELIWNAIDGLLVHVINKTLEGSRIAYKNKELLSQVFNESIENLIKTILDYKMKLLVFEIL